MLIYYFNRALRMLRENGPLYLVKTVQNFFVRHILLPNRRRVKLYTLKNHLLNRIRYDAPPPPYKPIFTHPKDIDFKIRKSGNGIKKIKYDGLAQTKGGNWDLSSEKNSVNENPIINGIYERFVNNKCWEETEYFGHYFNKYESGYNDGSVKELENQCQRIDKLFSKIECEGYQRGHTGSNVRSKNVGHRDRMEILVVIDRKGEFYLWDGKHRFAIARILESKIPIQIVCRHEQWQEIRDDIYNNGFSEEQDYLRNHPDLQDIRD